MPGRRGGAIHRSWGASGGGRGPCWGLPFILSTGPSLLKLPSFWTLAPENFGLQSSREACLDYVWTFTWAAAERCRSRWEFPRQFETCSTASFAQAFFSSLQLCSLCCVQVGLNPESQIRKDSISEILHVRPHHQRLILSDVRSAKRLFDSQRVLQLSSKDPFGTLELLLVLNAEL